MRPIRMLLLPLLALTLAGPVAAQESGSFVVRLGVDTTSVEHYTRSATRIVVDQVGRYPRVLRRHFEYDVANGLPTHVMLSATVPGASAPMQSIDVTVAPDSLRMAVRNGAAPVQNTAVALPAGALLIASSSPWAAYETATLRLAREKADSLRVPCYVLGFPAADQMVLRRMGRDSVELRLIGHQDVFHLSVDRTGHILAAVPIAGTGKVNARRVPGLDVNAYTSAFAAYEQQAGAMGQLSLRDTVQVANVGGATIWVDYGRPGKRGRTVYGSLVPYGEVWRTGANGATQFRTDKPLVAGGTTIPAGMYTLWSIPSPGGWKLLVNSQTGQWGTEHDPAKDLYTLDMTVEPLPDRVERFTVHVLPREGGGVLQLDWDTTRASLEFKTQP